MRCSEREALARVGKTPDMGALVAPMRQVAVSEPEAPVKPAERPTETPRRDDPRYPTHTPPKPGTQPSFPCPGTDDPDESYPACRLSPLVTDAR